MKKFWHRGGTKKNKYFLAFIMVRDIAERNAFSASVAQGKTYKELLEIHTNLPRRTLNNRLKQLRLEGNLTPKKSSGRPQKARCES